MAIKIIDPGLRTSVQDLGRPGYYHLGIPVSGGMDRYSLRAANLLVGNQEDAAVLEAVFVGPKIKFETDTTVAVTGANLPTLLDGKEKENWCAFQAKAGQTLSFDYLRSGARIYIAFGGGINVPLKLGSRSTYTLGALGGFKGRNLEAGDTLPIGFPSGMRGDGVSLPKELRQDVDGKKELRVLTGIYWDRITEESKKTFFDDEWQVAPEADRIGYRFKGGKALKFVEREQPFGAGSDPSNIVDGCYPYGSIQVPGGTEPIVLHRDAVSGGGYFMLGTVISADMDKIGQMMPNTPVRFISVDMGQTLSARKQRKQKIENLRAFAKKMHLN